MATSATTSLPMWLAGCTYDGDGASDLRNSGVTAFFYDQGIVTGSTIGLLGGVIGGAGLVVGTGTGMTVTVQPGSFVVPNTASAVAGGYVSTLAQQATLTVATADPTNPRIDIVVANVVDNGNSTSFGEVQIITGTPAGSPTVPSAPANSITLAQISVPANATSITSGNITGTRPFTTATGGVLKAAKGSVTGYNGQLAFDPSSGSFYHNTNAAGATQARVLPFAPVTGINNGPDVNVTSAAGQVQVCSATFTCDGNTDLAITAKWAGIYQNSPTNSSGIAMLLLDSATVPLDAVLFNTHASDVGGAASPANGGGWTTYTSAALGTTPSAGTHTIRLKFAFQSVSGSFLVSTSISYAPAFVRVSPVTL